MTIKLGQEVRDRVTGYRGIAVSRTTYLQGCERVMVQPKVDEKMTYPKPQPFDEPDLEVVGNGILPPEPKPTRSGGPHLTAERKDY